MKAPVYAFILPRAISLALLLGCGAAVLTAPTAAIAQDGTLNLREVEISTLIATVSEMTGKSFIIDPRVKGKVTVVSNSQMSPDAVYETFLAVLQVHNFAAIPSASGTIKIVPEVNAKQEGAPSIGEYAAAPDDVITRVIPIENVPAAQLVPILRPLVPQYGHLAAYSPSNMLILSDRAANIIRMRDLIRSLDQSTDREIEVIKLEYASAREVTQTLTTLNQQAARGDANAAQITVLPDERTNSILIGGDRATRARLRDIVTALDTPLEAAGGTQVIYLQFASAENLAPILQGLGEQAAQAEAGGAAAASGAARGGSVRVIAEPDINALVVTAPPKIMTSVRDVIAQLDIRRAQVLVEAIIAEVSESKSRELGIDSAVFNGERVAATTILSDQTQSALGSLGAAGTSGISASGAAIAGSLIGNGFTSAAGRVVDGGTSFLLLLRAIASDSNSNILSTPSLVTMDNEEAEISVGQEVPFLTGSFSNTGGNTGAVNPFQTIDRRDVGISLSITPQVSRGDTVQLQITQEASSLDSSSGSQGAVDLVTNQRSLSTTVMVDSGEILVLGGLIDEQVTDGESRVPLLGDIPLLGNLFKSRSATGRKRNLMIFIRPVILRNRADSNYYTRLKYDSLRDVQAESRAEGGFNLISPRERPILFELDRRGSVPPPPSSSQADMPRGARESGPTGVYAAPGSNTRLPTATTQSRAAPMTAPVPSDAPPSLYQTVPQSQPEVGVQEDEERAMARDFRQEAGGNAARRARWP